MLHRNLRLFMVAGGLALLAGCSTVLPGTSLALDADHRVPSPSVSPELSDVKVRVFSITPEYLATMPAPQVIAPVPNPALDAELQRYEYRIGPGDMLSVMVWDHPEFQGNAIASAGPGMAATMAAAGGGLPAVPSPLDGSRAPQGLSVQVQRDGMIYFPFIGRLKVAGSTLPVVREQLTKGLTRFIQSPQIDVAVSGFRSQRIYLTGDLPRAGSLPITTEPLTLFDAITQIGLVPTPDMESVTLVRDGVRRSYSLEKLFRYGDTSQNVLLRNNDMLHFSRNFSRKVFVLGETTSRVAGSTPTTGPGLQIPNDGLTLGAALAGAGGLDQLAANPRGVFVMRASTEVDRGIDVYQLDLSNATAYVLADRFPLKQRDFVYVTAAPIVRFNRVMQQILPSVANLFFLSNLGGN